MLIDIDADIYDLTRELEKAQHEITRLKQENAELMEKNIELMRDNKEMKEVVDVMNEQKQATLNLINAQSKCFLIDIDCLTLKQMRTKTMMMKRTQKNIILSLFLVLISRLVKSQMENLTHYFFVCISKKTPIQEKTSKSFTTTRI